MSITVPQCIFPVCHNYFLFHTILYARSLEVAEGLLIGPAEFSNLPAIQEGKLNLTLTKSDVWSHLVIFPTRQSEVADFRNH